MTTGDVRDVKPVERALTAERCGLPVYESSRVEAGKAVREDRPAREPYPGNPRPSRRGGLVIRSSPSCSRTRPLAGADGTRAPDDRAC